MGPLGQWVGERLEALTESAERWCAGALRVRPVSTGMHAVADLVGVDGETVFREAAARGIEVVPLSAYFAGKAPAADGLVLGFTAVDPAALDRGMQGVAAAIEAATRPRPRRRAD